jgi:hypothetical protein
MPLHRENATTAAVVDRLNLTRCSPGAHGVTRPTLGASWVGRVSPRPRRHTASVRPRRFGVRGPGRAFGRRLVAVSRLPLSLCCPASHWRSCRRTGSLEPLDAVLPGGQVRAASKAATSRRSPKDAPWLQPKERGPLSPRAPRNPKQTGGQGCPRSCDNLGVAAARESAAISGEDIGGALPRRRYESGSRRRRSPGRPKNLPQIDLALLRPMERQTNRSSGHHEPPTRFSRPTTRAQRLAR